LIDKMLYKPKNSKYKKFQKKKIKHFCRIKTNKINNIFFGTFALKSLKKTFITANQIEAVRRALSKVIKRQGKI